MKHKLVKFGGGIGLIGLSYYFLKNPYHHIDRNGSSYPIQNVKEANKS